MMGTIAKQQKGIIRNKEGKKCNMQRSVIAGQQKGTKMDKGRSK